MVTERRIQRHELTSFLKVFNRFTDKPMGYLGNASEGGLVLISHLPLLVEADASADRASQIRTVDRSERIRTYNFPENRIADHRINFKAHNLDQVLDGDLDPLFDALAAADRQAKLQSAS